MGPAMDLNLKALIGVAYLIPIAITLRKIYTPTFETPEQMALVVAKITKDRGAPRDMRDDQAAS
jgi:hypothetical protein